VRISELSRRSGAPVSTIKFYIREGLLPAGERTSPNQARYADDHLQRIALIRALREVCGLGTEAVGRVLRAMDPLTADAEPTRLALTAMEEPSPMREGAEAAEHDAALAEVTSFLDGVPWTRSGHHAEFADRLAVALCDLRRLVDPRIEVDFLAPYARAAWALAEAEYDSLPGDETIQPQPGDPLAHPVRMAILGILLLEPVVLTMRRYALYARGSRLYDGDPLPPVETVAGD
jgi:DNA-binding transcriptional MerR regulator